MPVSKPQLEPITAKRISGRKPARHDHSGLPASLKDWLVCKAALEIRQRGRGLTEDGSHAGTTTAKRETRARIPPAASVRP